MGGLKSKHVKALLSALLILTKIAALYCFVFKVLNAVRHFLPYVYVNSKAF